MPKGPPPWPPHLEQVHDEGSSVEDALVCAVVGQQLGELRQAHCKAT